MTKPIKQIQPVSKVYPAKLYDLPQSGKEDFTDGKHKFNRYRFLVSLKVPQGVTRTDTERYLREAIKCWNQSFSPDDPLFGVFDRGGSIGVGYPSKDGESNKIIHSNK